MSFPRRAHNGSYPGDDRGDRIEPAMPQSTYGWPGYQQGRRSSTPTSEKGDSSDTLRDYDTPSRPDSYVAGFPPTPTARPTVGLVRNSGNISYHGTPGSPFDAYDESPPRTPNFSKPSQPWAVSSRPQSEVTLIPGGT